MKVIYRDKITAKEMEIRNVKDIYFYDETIEVEYYDELENQVKDIESGMQIIHRIELPKERLVNLNVIITEHSHSTSGNKGYMKF